MENERKMSNVTGLKRKIKFAQNKIHDTNQIYFRDQGHDWRKTW